ncbi:PAS domain-containing protein [Kordiimonas pumila]|uniref:PAS domain-containing protein n=1 Tax=Kordiimonas pumila TaxID=2161677 RepID=A0ABV7D9A1_9PROT|nr:PAS domain-containing protein [Kordiimonas pumila]
MLETSVRPVNEELHFVEDEVIVSKTDLKGRITYANDVFCRLAEMPTSALIGKPHSIIRHPDMPRTIFRFLWERLEAGHEIFAYVKNMSATGRYYWVFAHVTPSFVNDSEIIGYHSNRRFANKETVKQIAALYREILTREADFTSRKDGMQAGYELFQAKIAATGMSYDEFIWSYGV